jgi:hypothetical protein
MPSPEAGVQEADLAIAFFANAIRVAQGISQVTYRQALEERRSVERSSD